MAVMENHNIKRHAQQGGALIILVLILVITGTAALFSMLDGSGVRIERDKKTAAVLAEAKSALIGYATAVDLTPSLCAGNCRRPGDLPCPDTNNDGTSDACAGSAIGRLPWKSLGISDLRDGDNERLWYAVSNNFKNSPRVFPLNSDTFGTITLRDTAGNMVNDGSLNSGLVAVVFSPGAAITRQDAVNQVRDNAANQNNPINYLDVALGEDNQNFINGSTDGFIMGPIKAANGSAIVNDHLLAITRDEMNQAMEARVMGDVRNALLDYYIVNHNFPNAADFSDLFCLGAAQINPVKCSESTATHGRVPANPSIAWNATSILRRFANNNWFQQNGWRGVIHYAVAPACATGATYCGGGGGLLTLNHALFAPDNAKQVVVIAAGRTLGAQSHANPTLEANYLEDENQTPLDGIYTRTVPVGVTFNDHAVSIP